MTEYIEREAALAVIRRLKTPAKSPAQKNMLRAAEGYIQKIPDADIEPVKRGHNIYPKSSRFECSLCGYEDWDTITCTPELHNFCPNCGARMNQEKDHGN